VNLFFYKKEGYRLCLLKKYHIFRKKRSMNEAETPGISDGSMKFYWGRNLPGRGKDTEKDGEKASE